MITTGGTGVTGRDVTPEALAPGRREAHRRLRRAVPHAQLRRRSAPRRCSRAPTPRSPAAPTSSACRARPGACRDGWDEILRFQLDIRHRPCNFAELIPRLREHEGLSRTFFTADTHFGHGGALGLFRRPFPSVAEMDAALVERWNEAVAPEDTRLAPGRLRRPRVAPTAPPPSWTALHGAKHLIAGNNDPPAIRALPGWAAVRDYAELELDGRRLVLCHYPLRAWNGQHRGALQLHGHSHGRLKPLPRQFDVGVDAWGFRPVTLGELTGTPVSPDPA